jgi:hypothetical protein
VVTLHSDERFSKPTSWKSAFSVLHMTWNTWEDCYLGLAKFSVGGLNESNVMIQIFTASVCMQGG